MFIASLDKEILNNLEIYELATNIWCNELPIEEYFSVTSWRIKHITVVLKLIFDAFFHKWYLSKHLRSI